MTPTLPSIVAASGLSTRMGTSKALLEVEGRTFLARILDALRAGGGDPILVVVRDPDGPEASEIRLRGGRPILNPDPSPGPISSLQAGLLALPEGTEGVLFSPVDHPFFSPDTVRRLIKTFHATGAPLVAPSFKGRRGHPVLFGNEVFSELLGPDLLEGARTVVGRYLDRRRVVEVGDPGILADINTPEDLKNHLPS